MALQFVNPKTVGLAVNVDVNSSGNIKMSGETGAASKTFTLNGFNINGDATAATTVLSKVLGDIGGATYTLASAVKKYNVPIKEVS